AGCPVRVFNKVHGCPAVAAHDFLFIEIENSYQGGGLVQKGTGLSNIKAVTEKYHGAMSVKTQGTVFVLNVLLIIPQPPESILRKVG
ncbi:MAG: ATP-binding protein, partial [Lachnospiraceae bacterium]|nr:ATP-binding protein [Lachnospiraceae bacterium]